MKKTFMIILLALLSACFLNASIIEQKGLNATFDIPALTSGKTLTNVLFTTQEIASPVAGVCNYQEFDTVRQFQAKNITLNVINSGSDFYGISSSPLFISFQVYSAVPVDIVIRPNGPLVKTEDDVKINWIVYPVVDGNPVEGVFAGTLVQNTGEVAYTENASFVAFRSDHRQWGISGSKELQIKTQVLFGKGIGNYTATLTAVVQAN